MKSYADKIREMIKKMKLGTIFFADDFLIDNRQAVRVVLSRLVKGASIIRLGPGIYLKPKYSNLIKSFEYPSMEEIALALANKEKARIIHSGAYAVHKIGLSTQVPVRSVFLTDGSPRKITLDDGREIVFKRTTAKNLSYKNNTIRMVVAALQEIGSIAIDDTIRKQLANILASSNVEDNKEDIQLAPEWIQKELLQILS
jgi:predicted transcriptional regulator of viral defense system